MRSFLWIPLFFFVVETGAAQSQQWGTLRPGQHASGFRIIETHDPARVTRPPVDYAGRRSQAELAVPMQIAVWYPATSGSGSPVTTFDLLLLAARKENFGPATAADSQTVRGNVPFFARIAGADSALAPPEVERNLAVVTASRRNARPASGSFPVAVIGSSGSIATVSILSEYLASHGWIVLATPSSSASAAMEVTDPKLAIEDRVRAMEFTIGEARTVPGADLTRLVLIGVNFDGYAALELQMRQMRASGVVTINGPQTIDDRAAHLRESRWYDPVRLRVPVLNIHWDENAPGFRPANLSFMEEIKYADRRHVVIPSLGHFGLVSNPLLYSFTNSQQRAGYEMLVRGIRAEIARSVASEPITAEGSFEPGSLKHFWSRPALPAVPTRAEFAELLWPTPDIARASSIFREARSRDPTVQLFRESDVGLYVFRYSRSGRMADAVALARLSVEAFPASESARALLERTLASANLQ